MHEHAERFDHADSLDVACMNTCDHACVIELHHYAQAPSVIAAPDLGKVATELAVCDTNDVADAPHAPRTYGTPSHGSVLPKTCGATLQVWESRRSHDA